MSDNLLVLLEKKRQLQELTVLSKLNDQTERFGLTLTEADAKALIRCRNTSLAKSQRVEFGNGILDKLIYQFCDSQYIQQDTYLETLERLLEIFYEFKNRSQDRLSDEELLSFMGEQFEGVCYGDLDYLERTCLERFAASIRKGYDGFQKSQGKGEYEKLSEEARWDKDLYMEVVKELFW